MPPSPSQAGKATKEASASKTARSGVMMLRWKRPRAMIGFLGAAPLLERLRLGRRLLDGADVHEGLVRELVPLAVAELLEGADGLGERRVVAGEAGELLGDE